MRIVQVANFYTPTSGGQRIALDKVGRGYREAGHDRILIVPGRVESVEQTPSGRRVTVRGVGLPGLGDYRVLTARRRVLRLLDAAPPDVLEVSDKISLVWLARWSRRRGVPLVLFSHERLDAILRSRVPRWIPLRAAADTINRRLSGLADRVIVTSAFSAAEFERIGAPNVHRIPLGVDLAEFRPAADLGERRSIADMGEARSGGDLGGSRSVADGPPSATHTDPRGDRPVFLVTVTRLSREKRPEAAIDTVAALHMRGVDARLVIIGDGPQRERLRHRARGLPVTFLGHLSDRPAIARLVAAADVALFPCPVESFGLATLEALACGTPVVVPPEGAARELLGGPGSGVVGDGTPSGMAEAVLELLALPEARRRAAARASAERYPWAATVVRLLNGHEQISRRAGAEVSASE
ncbi:glycosyltransferase [Actinoallomurus rhizosphaericola]|uniref:glycosyltransferase n=1 Tax=Actinoallomurus rhizosphaericola TaxID=2952536 RepID=UPI0020936D04|nr:glycosyltransferase [Actinoallomurus rhizosphaericola]MCO5995477.1 glycosyltransferase [Actinoallomurus rhizosphaericola]